MGKNQNPGSGINIPDPQHWLELKKIREEQYGTCKDPVLIIELGPTVAQTRCNDSSTGHYFNGTIPGVCTYVHMYFPCFKKASVADREPF
jgi:hypothetical protein